MLDLNELEQTGNSAILYHRIPADLSMETAVNRFIACAVLNWQPMLDELRRLRTALLICSKCGGGLVESEVKTPGQPPLELRTHCLKCGQAPSIQLTIIAANERLKAVVP